MEPEVMYEAAEPEKIIYQRGSVYIYLYGFNASLYRGMIWMYGKEEATERYWWLWNKKAETAPKQISAAAL